MVGTTLHVANIGDSRAVVASDKQSTGAAGGGGSGDSGDNSGSSLLLGGGSSLTSRPVTFDQTPYRRDERERCKTWGCR
jgi:serine/threonine protein phosphatase PrpC